MDVAQIITSLNINLHKANREHKICEHFTHTQCMTHSRACLHALPLIIWVCQKCLYGVGVCTHKTMCFTETQPGPNQHGSIHTVSRFFICLSVHPSILPHVSPLPYLSFFIRNKSTCPLSTVCCLSGVMLNPLIQKEDDQ